MSKRGVVSDLKHRTLDRLDVHGPMGPMGFLGDRVVLLINFGDLHSGAAQGVRPYQWVDQSGEIRYAPNALVNHLLGPWDRHWLDVRAEKKRLTKLAKKVVILGIFNGDGPDKNYHDREGYEMLTPHRAKLVELCHGALAPALDVLDYIAFNRGTRAHEGGTGEMMEMLAREVVNSERVKSGRLKVVRADKENDPNAVSQYWFDKRIEGTHVVIGHTPTRKSRLPYMRNSAADRTAFEYSQSFWRLGDAPPDLMMFNHVHYMARGGGTPSNPVEVSPDRRP